VTAPPATDVIDKRARSLVPWLLVGGPTLALLVFFVLPNAILLSAGFLKSEGQTLTGQLTFENYAFFFGRPTYVAALLRTFFIALSVGVLVVVLGFPLAYFLTRTRSRWKGLLIALSLSPLLASVVVRTYGWFIIFNRFGALNDFLLYTGLIKERLAFMPSTGAIIVGLTHSLLPYGVLTIMAAVQSLNPQLELAAMSLGASRTKTFLRVTLPLCLPGIAGGFILAFSISLSAYATPAILGGPSTQTIATLLYTFMIAILDWSVGSMLGTILIVTSGLMVYLATKLGAKRSAL